MKPICFSIDVESWVYSRVPELEGLDSNGRKQVDKGYIRDSMLEICDLFEKHDSRTTFFILAELFEWYPDVVREAAERGHEIGLHGYRHIAVDDPEVLRSELAQCCAMIDAVRPEGFRAPFMRLSEACIDVLVEYGFRYDSSSYAPASLLKAHSRIPEFPVTTTPVLPMRPGLVMPRDFGVSMKRGELPYGSAMLFPFLRSAVCRYIRRNLQAHGYAHLFLHNLQVVPPPTSLFRAPVFLLKNPGCIQFTVSSKHTLERVLSRFKAVPIRELL